MSIKRSIHFGLFLLLLVFATSIHAQKGMQTLLEEQIFTDVEGNTQSLAAIIKANEGKVLFIDFWASWCGPCKKVMPFSKTLHEELGAEPVEFIYLSLDDVEDKWKKSIDKLDIASTGQHYRRGRNESVELLKFFYIYSIPHYMIIGKDGKIINRDALPPDDPKTARQLKKWAKKQ